MKIEIKVYEGIVSSIPDTLPETGGIIGEKDGIINVVEFDVGVRNKKKCSYSPDVIRLNKTIQLWQNQGIRFCGIFHTHYFGVESLSSGDMEYIKIIMNSMPKTIAKLYFPLVVMPQRKMIAYVAVKEKEQLNIYQEKIIFQGGTDDEK